MSEITQHEPAPVPNGERPIYEYLIDLIRQRAEAGSKKYGTHLQAHNGRDALMDAMQESIDLNQYLMQMVVETTADRDSEHRWADEYHAKWQETEKERDAALALLKDAVEVLKGVTCDSVTCPKCSASRAFLSRDDVKAIGGRG